MIKVIFCALNEAQNLEKLVINLGQTMQALSRDYEIIACLDGSTDASLQVLQAFQNFYPIKILPLKNQRGLGLAYKRLFIDAIKNSADEDLVLTLDADNTHDPKQIREMLEHFEKNSLDLLVASRFCDKSMMANFPFYRKLISKATSILLQTIFAVKKISGKKLQDYTSGYRIYKVQKLRQLFEKEKDNFIREAEFTYTCELLIKLSRLNCRLDETALSYDYGKKIGESKLRICRNFWRLLVMLVVLKFKD